MSELTIRVASEEDVDIVRGVGIASYCDHFSDVWTPEGIQKFLQPDFSIEVLRKTLGTRSKHLWLLACAADQRVVGYAKVNWSVPDPVMGIEGAELQKIYFLKSESGKGYGAELFACVLEHVRARSCGRLWLGVLKCNTRAQKFYAKAGFRVIGEIPFKTDVAELGMVVMDLQIPSVGVPG